MPRYELVEGTSNKFWEISLEGNSFTAIWGRIGSSGQSKRQEFEDPQTARNEHDKLIASKVKKGYQLVNGTAPIAAAGDRQRLTVRLETASQWRELILEGARLTQRSGRIGKASENVDSAEKHDSVNEARDMRDLLVFRYAKNGFKEVSRRDETIRESDTPEAVAERITENPALERACLDHPTNPEHWTVYADWLQAHGDPRGELAALHLAQKSEHADAFLNAHREALWGELSRLVGTEIYGLVQRHGFTVGASLKRADVDSDTDLAVLTKEFLALPMARFIGELRFGLASHESNNDWTATLASVLASIQAADLRSLAFADYTYQDCEISWTPFGDFSAIWRGLPRLEHLHVRSGVGGELGSIAHAQLKTFIRESGGLSGGEFDAIAKAKWPQLERLDVWTGSSGYEGEVTADMLGPLLAAKGLPKLTHLGIVNSELLHAMIPELAKSKVLPQLKVLDLSKGVLTDNEVDDLIAHKAAFAHLQKLDLSENLFHDRIDAIQAAFPNAVLGEQRDDHGDGEDHRYVAVGE